jgi:alginate O-acetyltransferase complex protein AlgI
MLFNSWLFAVFFVAVYLAYLRLGHRGQNWLLLISSYLFYAAWDWRFLGLILLSTGIDFTCGLRIAASRSQQRKRWLVAISVLSNLGMLSAFKYFDFFVASIEALLTQLGFSATGARLGIVVPVGISFYTFQTMSCTIDVYRGETKACGNLRDFALFVAFFPQLVAGPIERGRRLVRQVTSPRRLRLDMIRQGMWWIVLGYFMKVYAADNLAKVADHVFALPDPTGSQALLGSYAFAFQIYGDFAGYSLIARGLARLMGFDLMRNFFVPYAATSPSEFWRRWHISLSTWLRDYLYIPLGGNRKGPGRTLINLMLTMLLGGLWHGAHPRFLLWGLFHGLLLIAWRPFRRREHPIAQSDPWWSRWAKRLVFFHLICFGWVIFRCENIEQIIQFPWLIVTDFAWSRWSEQTMILLLLLAGPVVLLDWPYLHTQDDSYILKWLRGHRWAICLTMIVLLYVFGSRTGEQFIYFQF